MKKFLVSLVLIFSLFFSFGGVESSAKISQQQEKKIDKAMEGFFEELHMYEYDKLAIKVKNFLKVIDRLKGKYKKQEIIEILDYIYEKLEDYIMRQTIIEYYFLIEQGELEKAFSMKIVNAWDENFNKKEELNKFKEMYNFGEKVQIQVGLIQKNINANFSFEVTINYGKSLKIEKYNILMNVNPNHGMLPFLIKTINVDKISTIKKEIK